MTVDQEISRAKAALAHLKHRPRFTPGVVVYQLFHRPLGWWQRVSSAGVLNTCRRLIARHLINQHLLQRSDGIRNPHSSEPAITVDLLTGRRFCSESIIVAHSFAKRSRRRCDFHFHDDGTLGETDAAKLQRWFPESTLHRHTEIESRLASELPASRFPVLHAIREVYVPIKKLTDLAAGREGWRLYLDSDLLFFREPTALIRCLDNRQPCHLVDTVPSYGVPVEFLSTLAGRTVHRQVNSGLYYRKVDTIDWQFLEESARHILNRFGYSYFIEQALAALLLAREGAVPLDDSYIVLPNPDECRQPTKILHHYVNQSRWAFYVNGWKAVNGDSTRA